MSVTIKDRTEQVIRYIYKMRDPDIVRPHEEADLRNLLVLHGEAVLDEVEKRLTNRHTEDHHMDYDRYCMDCESDESIVTVIKGMRRG